MPAKTKTSKSKKSKKQQEPVVVEQPAPAVVEEPAPVVVEEPASGTSHDIVETTPEVTAPLVETTQEPDISHEFDHILDELKNLKLSIISMTTRVTKLQKRVARESRKGKKKPRTGASKNNGFSKPVDISPELIKFLGLEKGQKLARTEVTKGITKYIKEHELQDKNDKRIILADTKLKKLLSGGEKKLTSDVPLTYFNLQTYLKHHYPKTQVV